MAKNVGFRPYQKLQEIFRRQKSVEQYIRRRFYHGVWSERINFKSCSNDLGNNQVIAAKYSHVLSS